MLVKIAVKNIVAYKKRSLVTLLLTAVSTGLLVFSTAFMDGSHVTMIKNAVELYPGYLQITGKGFRDTPSLDNIMISTRPVHTLLEGMSNITTYAERFESFVLFASENKSTGAMFTGIEPEKEVHISRLRSALKEGVYLPAGDEPNVYIGRELAKKLQVTVGDQLSYIGTAADYSFAADTLTVAGIFQTGLYDFDASSAFVSKAYFDLAMSADNCATHIIVLPEFPEEVDSLAREISSKLPEDYESTSWKESMSGLVQAMELDSIFGYVTLGIIFIVIFFVIMIYTFLGVFMRIREIGILRAIGTRPQQIFALLISETVIISLLGVMIGGIAGGSLACYFEIHPMVFSGYEEQFKQYGLVQSSLPAIFSVKVILRDMVIMFLLAVSSTIYPIFKVLRFTPVEAIRHV